MPAPDPNDYAAHRAGFPGNDLEAVPLANMRTCLGGAVERTLGIPANTIPHIGEILVCRAVDGKVSPASLAGLAGIDFGGLALLNFDPKITEVSASQALNQRLHGGGTILTNSASLITLTFQVNADPAAGIVAPFACVLARVTSGALKVATPGLTNVFGQTTVETVATVIVHGTKFLMFGGTSE
jgi:hypothetical protein